MSCMIKRNVRSTQSKQHYYSLLYLWHHSDLIKVLHLCAWDENPDKENDIAILSFHTFTDSPLLLVAMVTCSRLPSEDGSVISSESVKEVSGKGLSVQKATAQQKLTKEETRKSNGEKCLHCFSTFPTCAVRPQNISEMSWPHEENTTVLEPPCRPD